MADDLSFNITAKATSADAAIAGVGKSAAATAVQIEAANLKVEKSAKTLSAAEEKYGKGSLQARDAANKLAQANLSLSKSMDKTEESTGEAEKGVSKLHLALGALAGAGVAAGVGAAIGKALDVQASTAKLAAQLGATGPEAARYGKIAGTLYSQNFGDSVENVDDAIKNVVQNIGALGDEGSNSLQTVTANVLSLSQAFDVDLFDVTKAVGTQLRSGLAKDATTALDTIAFGLQKIPGAGEDLLDTLTEYSVQFKALGIDSNQALAFIAAAMQGGARNTDLAADALKEFNLRAKDTTNTGAQQALDELGLSGLKTAEAIAGGGSSATSAMQQVFAALKAVKDPAEQATLATKLLGTQSEDLQQAFLAVDPQVFSEGLQGVAGSAQNLSNTLGGTNASKIETYKRQLEQLGVNAANLPGPLGAAAAGVVGFGGVAIGAGANIAQLGQGLAAIPAVSTAASASLVKLRAATLAAAPAFAVLGAAIAAVELGPLIGKAEVADVGTKKLATSLDQLGQSGKLGKTGLDLFTNSGGFGLIHDQADDTGDALDRFGRQAERALGDGLSQKAGRALNFGKSVGQLSETTKQLDASFTSLVQAGHIDQAAAAQEKFVQAAKDAGVPVDKLNQLFPSYNAAIKEAASNGNSAASAASGLSAAVDIQGDAAANAAKKQEDYNKSLADYTNAALAARGDARGFQAALDSASDAIKTNGKTLDITTPKGRANAEALDAIAAAGLKLANDAPAGVNAQKHFQDTLDTTRARLIAAAEKMGSTRAEAKKLANQILGVPSAHKVNFTDNTAAMKTRITSTQSKINSLHGKSITISIAEVVTRRGTSSATHDSTIFAVGGAVKGPGTSTSDSINARLSNGEHVISAAEVARLGGHAAVERIRKGGAGRAVGSIAGPSAGGGGSAAVVLTIESGGSSLDDALVEILRKAVRVRGGGNVQTALGR